MMGVCTSLAVGTGGDVMKAVIRRLRKLELRFGSTAAVPSAAEVIIERLVAGEWQSALKLLEESPEGGVSS
jgi:hypothetical protein